MKAKFTLLAGLLLLATSIYALIPVHNKISKLTSRSLKNMPEMHRKSAAHNSLQQKTGINKQINSLKSAQVIKQRLDSISEKYWDDTSSQWITDSKVEWTYDVNLKLTHELIYELDETTGQLTLYWKNDYSYDANGNMIQTIYYGGWADDSEQIHLPVTVSSFKDTYSYDANGNMTQEIDYKWDKISNQFVTNYKYNYTYDANGKMTQEIDSYLYADQSEGKTKAENTYDANGNITQELNYNWSSFTNDWGDPSKLEYTYDASGNQTKVLGSSWSSYTNAWSTETESDYTYNSNRNMTQKLDYGWDGHAIPWVWVATGKSNFTYDSKGNMTQNLDYSWDINTSAYVNTYKKENTYDANGHITQEREYNWDSNTNAWVGFSKDSGEFTFDANGNPTSRIYYDWDQITSQFIPMEKDVNTYDLSYTFSDLIFPPDWAEDGVLNMPLESTYYDWDKVSSSWGNGYKDVYYYSEISITSVPKTVASGINVYPNPVSDYIKLSGISGVGTFNLYNLQGKLILSKTLTGGEPVNVSGLSKGAYIYNLNVDGKMQSGKLVKE